MCDVVMIGTGLGSVLEEGYAVINENLAQSRARMQVGKKLHVVIPKWCSSLRRSLFVVVRGGTTTG